MVSGSGKAQQRTMLRVALGATAAVHLLAALVCFLPWGPVHALCERLWSEDPPEKQQQQRSTILLLRGAGALSAWVGVLVLLPAFNPRRYTGVIDVSIGMLVLFALLAALLGSHVKAPPALYLSVTILYGLLATFLGALRGAATYRSY